ncbi:MAG: NUDIX hydrolase [Erysipelotrichaceae bacterium]|nr:NUDIX hydrolase [Erysipelotrichaceae bacterium]
MPTDLREELLRYQPVNEQEREDKRRILEFMETEEDLFLRGNETCHFTASAWVTSPDRTKVLMVYHKLYDSWSWLGGHADGEEDLKKVALKEVKEESGLQHVRLLSDEIISLEILTVDGHEKRGRYVPSHLHLNVTYLMEADPDDPVFIKEDENSGVAWFGLEEAIERSSEPWFKERIYPKLNRRIPNN